jgi:hypothetical protein
MSDKDKVVGKALYLELRSTNQTYQVLITPDGISTNGKNVPSMIYRRQISAAKPRKGWKHGNFPTLSIDEFGVFQKRNKDDAMALSSTRLEFHSSTLNQLVAYHYKIYKQPILVEVSAEDLEGIRNGKTPYKILGRITRVRRTLGFGESLFVI